MNFTEGLHRRAASFGGKIVFADGWDQRIRDAAREIEELGMAGVVVLDRKIEADEDLEEVAAHLRVRKPDRVDSDDHALELARDPYRFAAGLVALGKVDAAVCGVTRPTAAVLRAALWAIGPATGIKTVSSAFYMVMPSQGSSQEWWGRGHEAVLTFTDAAVVPDPTAEQLAEIAYAASRDRSYIVGDAPVVSFLSYSTRGSASGPIVDKVCEAVANFRQKAPAIRCDGELQADAALVRSS